MSGTKRLSSEAFDKSYTNLLDVLDKKQKISRDVETSIKELQKKIETMNMCSLLLKTKNEGEGEADDKDEVLVFPFSKYEMFSFMRENFPEIFPTSDKTGDDEDVDENEVDTFFSSSAFAFAKGFSVNMPYTFNMGGYKFGSVDEETITISWDWDCDVDDQIRENIDDHLGFNTTLLTDTWAASNVEDVYPSTDDVCYDGLFDGSIPSGQDHTSVLVFACKLAK